MVTVVNKTIGAGVTDYATLALFEAGTDNDLVSADEQINGLLQSELHDLVAADVNFGGSTTDATRYRHLTVASGARYDPITDTGARVRSSNATRTLRWSERYFRMSGFECENTGGGRCLNSTPSGDDFIIDGCFLHASGSAGYGLYTNHGSTGSICRNTVALSPNNTEDGFRSTAQTMIFHNCMTDGFANGYANLDGATAQIVNCGGIHGVEVFDSAQSYSAGTFSNNVSTDSTAPGGSSHTLVVDGDTWHNSASKNYRAVGTGSLADGGADLSAQFTTSIDGTARTGTWDVGPYDFTPQTVALGGPLVITSSTVPPPHVDIQVVPASPISTSTAVVAPVINQTTAASPISATSAVIAPAANQTTTVTSVSMTTAVVAPRVFVQQDVAVSPISSTTSVVSPRRVRVRRTDLYSCRSYAGDGTTLTFAIDFEFLHSDHVTASLDLVSQIQGTGYDYTVVGTDVVFAAAPTLNVDIDICRETPHPIPWVSFTQGARILQEDVDESVRQCLYYAEEVADLFL